MSISTSPLLVPADYGFPRTLNYESRVSFVRRTNGQRSSYFTTRSLRDSLPGAYLVRRRCRHRAFTNCAASHSSSAQTGADPATCRAVRFGVISDVQYGNKADKTNSRGATCGYRAALPKLARAVEDFNNTRDELACVLHLGDIIDGNTTEEKSLADLDVVSRQFERLRVPKVYHVVGNHCLAAPRAVLRSRLFQDHPKTAAYYSVLLGPGWRLVVLDTMDMSISPHCPNPEEAAQFVASHPRAAHPQMGLGRGHANGGIASEQIKWLQAQLSDCERMRERVVVAMHHPVTPCVAPVSHLLWNYEHVGDVLTASQSVAAVFNGHYHPGGYCVHRDTHFVGFEGVVETQPGENAYAVISLHDDRIEIAGRGVTASRTLHS